MNTNNNTRPYDSALCGYQFNRLPSPNPIETHEVLKPVGQSHKKASTPIFYDASAPQSHRSRKRHVLWCCEGQTADRIKASRPRPRPKFAQNHEGEIKREPTHIQESYVPIYSVCFFYYFTVITSRLTAAAE
jgi:hypothetical protein